MKLSDIRAPLLGFVAMGLFWGAWNALLPCRGNDHLYAAGNAAAGVSVLAPAAMSLVGRNAATGQRGAAVATVGVIAYSGFFLGPATLGFVANTFGLRIAIGVLPIALLLVIAIALLLRGALEKH